ncbi:Ig-like domain repeat protein, partial [Patescibacteria group bacterium]|nr:Ig-like domain repeat protein [Patescibacteria group bacterium]MBU4422005.1 Ig-like domain repeat protein [Patescibacteria group bacterium]
MGTFLKKQIKGRAIKLPMAILICALLVVGGGIAYKAVATHTATATTVPEFVAGGSTVGYGFNVTNNGTDSVYKITISVQTGSGFSIDTGTISCPTGWTKDSASFNSQAICITDVFSGDILTIGNSVNVAFNATSPTPTVDTQYAWGVATRDVNNGYTYNTDTKTTVDVTAPTTIDNAVTGWGNSNVTVTLTPTDNFVQDVPGSGVTNTYYCIYNSRETVCTPTTSGASMEVTCTEDSVCQKIVRYYSIDNVSKTEEVKTSAVIQIDKKEPVTAIAVGDPKYGTGTIYVKSTTNFTLTATDEGSGVASTTYKIDEGAIIDYSVAGAFTISTAGTHTITYWSVDNIGNTEAVNTLTVFVDDTEPSVGGITITPIFGSYISGTSNISAVITETGSGVASCDYALDGSTWVIARMTYADGICSVSNVDTSAATSINMRATDNVGNVGTSSAIAVTVDTINPAISNVAISPTTPTNDNTPTITFKVADSGSNVNVSTVKVSHGTAEYAATCTTLPDCSVTLPTQADGAYTFTISASDNVGNSASDSSLSGYVIDTVKPTTSDNAPTGWQKTDVTITLTPTDPAPSSGIAWTKYCTDTENTCEPTTEGTSLTISDEGTTYFRYASADLAGNIQNTVSRVVMIDKSVPATSKITAPTTGSHVKDAVTITADAVDNTNGSGIVKVEFYYGTNLINADLDNTDSTYSVDWNTTNVADNTVYSLTAKAIDQAGNPLTSTAVSVTVDNTPPTILTYTIDSEAISPINNDGIKDGIKIKITTDEICDFVIRIENQDGSLAVASEWVSNNTTSVTKPSDCYWKGTTLQCPSSPVYLSDGIYNIKVAITDKAGNSIDAPIKTITVDNLKPVIDSVMPANSTYVQSAVPEISATLSDTLSAIDDATIIMTVDTAVISSSYNSTTGKVSYAASSLGEGSHSVTVIVSDNAGNLHSNSWSFIVDTDDPETTLTANPVSPDGSNNWYVTAPTITLTCSDTINGCFKTYYKWGTSGTYAEYTEILTASEGADTLYYYSIDMAGNEETANNQEFKVDTTDPVVSVLGNAPTGWVVDDESLIPTVGCKDTSGSDCDTNSYKMMYSLIEITKCPTDLNLYSNPPTNVNQPMWVCAYGKDLAGNEDFSDPVHFKYSNTIQAAI